MNNTKKNQQGLFKHPGVSNREVSFSLSASAHGRGEGNNSWILGRDVATTQVADTEEGFILEAGWPLEEEPVVWVNRQRDENKYTNLSFFLPPRILTSSPLARGQSNTGETG